MPKSQTLLQTLNNLLSSDDKDDKDDKDAKLIEFFTKISANEIEHLFETISLDNLDLLINFFDDVNFDDLKDVAKQKLMVNVYASDHANGHSIEKIKSNYKAIILSRLLDKKDADKWTLYIDTKPAFTANDLSDIINRLSKVNSKQLPQAAALIKRLLTCYNGGISADAWWQLLQQGKSSGWIKQLLDDGNRYTQPVVLQALINGNQQQQQFAKQYLPDIPEELYCPDKLVNSLIDKNLTTKTYHSLLNCNNVFKYLTNTQLLTVISKQHNDFYTITQDCLTELSKCYPIFSSDEFKLTDQFYINLIRAFADPDFNYDKDNETIQMLRGYLLTLSEEKLSRLIKLACLQTDNEFLQRRILLSFNAKLTIRDKINLLANAVTVKTAYSILAADLNKAEYIVTLMKQILLENGARHDAGGLVDNFEAFKQHFLFNFPALLDLNSEASISRLMINNTVDIYKMEHLSYEDRYKYGSSLLLYIQLTRLRLQKNNVPWYLREKFLALLFVAVIPILTFITVFPLLIIIESLALIPELILTPLGFIIILSPLIFQWTFILNDKLIIEAVQQYFCQPLVFTVPEAEWDKLKPFKQSILQYSISKELNNLPQQPKFPGNGEGKLYNQIFELSPLDSFLGKLILNKHQYYRHKLWQNFYLRNKDKDIASFKYEIQVLTLKLAKSFLHSAEQFGGDKKIILDLKLYIEQQSLVTGFTLFNYVPMKKFELLDKARKQLTKAQAKLTTCSDLKQESRDILSTHGNWIKWLTPNCIGTYFWNPPRSKQLYEEAVQLLNTPVKQS